MNKLHCTSVLHSITAGRGAAALAAGAILTASALAMAQQPFTGRTWTTSKDFDEGVEVNVNHTVVPDQLQLNITKVVTPYIWVANAASNTVAQIRTDDGGIERMHNVGSSPSRTAVDKDGNVWVANRGSANITFIDAKTGATRFCPAGGLPRGLALDANGNVWVGNYNDANVWKVDPKTCNRLAVVNTQINPYGLAIDGRGIIWVSGISQSAAVRVDSANNQFLGRINLPGAPYGVTVDENNNGWLAIYSPRGAACRVDGATLGVNCTNFGSGGNGRGIAADGKGFIWIADSSRNSIHKFNGASMAEIGEWNTNGGSPIGVAADASGYIWAVNQSTANLSKFQLDGTRIGTWTTGGSGPYTYSDMTGFSLQTVTLRTGTWTVDVDGGVSKTLWGTISWNALNRPGMKYQARLRSADTKAGLANVVWTPYVESGRGPATDDKRWLQAEVQMTTTVETSSEIYDITIKTRCTSKPEACNGQDDDCDGIIDNGPAEVCDGIDNDCDGKIDNGNPGGGLGCQPQGGQGACSTGLLECQNGKLICVQNSKPQPETCNGLDDDCDGKVDENLERQCASICGSGVEVCINAQWQNCTARQPSPEVCDAVDNDCNGQIDDNNPEGGSECNTGQSGGCGKGKLECQGGILVCTPDFQPSPEKCDGLDNDCDGQIDEGNPEGGESCVTGVPGICGKGVRTCVASLLSCVPEKNPGTETCNRIDDDCDGVIDDGVKNACGYCGPVPKETCNKEDDDCNGKVDDGDLCDTGKSCINGECVRKCSAGECPRGSECRERGGEKWCVPFCTDVVCPFGEVCDPANGKCKNPCEGVTCSAGQACHLGKCVEDNCYEKGCPKGEICREGKCAKDPCEGNACVDGQFCRDGLCISSCANVSCTFGEKCFNGRCEKDPCADAKCAAGEVCDPVEGKCKGDPCSGVSCPVGRLCAEGKCQDNPCNTVRCAKSEQCELGECRSIFRSEEPNPADGGKGDASDGGGASDSAVAPGDAGDTPDPDPNAADAGEGGPDRKTANRDPGANTTPQDPGLTTPPKGCGCDTAPTGRGFNGAWLLLAAAAVWMIRRQRRG